MIARGMKFIYHWKGHEACYTSRVYQVKSVIRSCTCPVPNCFVMGKKPVPRRPHIHLTAKMIECPYEGIEKDGYSFGALDETTLIDLEDPNQCLEIISFAGCQLSIF